MKDSEDAAAAAQDCQVVIVGAGPVGLGLAIELGQRGIRCTLVERYSQPQQIPKGQNLTQRTMEHFYFWGAEKALRAARTIPADYGIGGLTAYGSLLGPHTYDWLQRDLVKPFYFSANERLPQYATEAVLRQRVAELPDVGTLYGWKAELLTAPTAACRLKSPSGMATCGRFCARNMWSAATAAVRWSASRPALARRSRITTG